ncbi:hypothetical protein QVD17_00615 [Tagetes erecta]|uniref:Uncharacterized protein n=1 Tax=Tagetes erecta TaxID=13708 RepID=A0AAD8L8Z7_TARER|nr:hypothetical protein QVD17_00615 [Tagetes erecta]
MKFQKIRHVTLLLDLHLFMFKLFIPLFFRPYKFTLNFPHSHFSIPKHSLIHIALIQSPVRFDNCFQHHKF